MSMVIIYQRMTDRIAETITGSVAAKGSRIPVPTVFARVTLQGFIAEMRTTAVMRYTVVIALAQSCPPFAMSKNTAGIIIMSISCVF